MRERSPGTTGSNPESRATSHPALLLIRSSDYRLGIMSPPLGPLYLAASVRQRCKDQWDIRLFDLGLSGSRWRDDVAALLDDQKPRIVGISALTHEMTLVRQLARLVRECTAEWPRPPLLILGGPTATSSPALALEWAGDDLDGILVGEGEQALPELLDRLTDGARPPAGGGDGHRRWDASLFDGLRGWYGTGAAQPVEPLNGHPEAGTAIGTEGQPDSETNQVFQRAQPVEDLDRLPRPAWDLLPSPGLYAHQPNWNGMLRARPYMSILTSRGCPYRCTYCHHFFGHKVRLHSAQRVLDEITELHDRFGIREFHIIDDIFNIDLERAKAVCEGILRSGLQLHLAFPNGIRGDRVDDELLGLLKQCGTYKISYGVETASPRLQRETGKNLDLRKLGEAVTLTRKLGMIPAGFFMFGFPGETREEMKETIRFAVNSDLLTAKFFQVIPYPGTALREKAGGTEMDRIAGPGLDQYHFLSSRISCSDLGPRALNDLLVEAYLRFFSRPGRVLALLRRHPDRRGALRDLRSLYGTLIRHGLRRLRDGGDAGSSSGSIESP